MIYLMKSFSKFAVHRVLKAIILVITSSVDSFTINFTTPFFDRIDSVLVKIE